MSQTFKKNAGPKSVYETITAILRGDAILKGLVGYNPQNPNIRRAFQPAGTWEKLVIYFLQPEAVLGDFSPNFRTLTLIVGLYVRENELTLNDMAERVIQLLDTSNGAVLSRPGFVHVYSSLYDGELVSGVYDESLKAFQKSLRFVLLARKEG